MSEGVSSPFNRSGLTSRSPPSTPAPTESSAPRAPVPKNDPPSVVATTELQGWMKSIEQHLNEICIVSAEGKLNNDQKSRIQTLCRSVSHSTSQLVVEYQGLKHKAVQNYNTLQHLQEKMDLSQRIHELKQCVEESSKHSPPPPSFADMIKKGTAKYIQPSTVTSVAIYPTDKTKSSDETKSLVQKIIRPEEMKLHVRGLRKTKNGGVVISTDSKDDIVKLKQSAHLVTSGLTVDEPLKRKPRIVIVGVPSSMQDSEVFKCIFQQNIADKISDLSLETFLASTKLSHKSGKKDAETCNFIIEVPALIRKALITQERVFVNWSSCPVRDFTLVTRCFKCQQYGHAAKTCKTEVETCGHCGEEGHAKKDCSKNAAPPKCATCWRFKKPSDHETGDPECPARKQAERRYINSIDYDGA